jgi:hypothetical protein
MIFSILGFKLLKLLLFPSVLQKVNTFSYECYKIFKVGLLAPRIQMNSIVENIWLGFFWSKKDKGF